MKKFNRALALVVAVLMLCSMLPMAVFAEETASTQFTVLSTTDIHGKVWDKNLLNGTNSTGLLNVATAVKEIRATYGDNVILIDNGDLYQGTPVASYNISQYTQGLTKDMNPMALALDYIGYDMYTLGNHEFNYAWDTMNDIYKWLAERGVPCVCANLYWEESGTRVFEPYMTIDLELDGQTFTVAIIGIENTDCTRWDVPDNYPGIIFASPENPSLDVAYEVEKVQKEMDEAGVDADFTILAYHSGLGSYTEGAELIYGTNTENQVLRTITLTTGIDMVVAGHDHSTSYSNNTYKNANGEDVLVVNGGGTNLTQSVFTATYADGEFSVTMDSSVNLNLGNYAVDEGLRELIAPYAEEANEYVNTSVGTLAGEWDGYNGNMYLTQTDTMDLINRAQIWAGSTYLNDKYGTVEALNAKLREIYGEDTDKQYNGDTLEIDISSTSVVTTGPATAGELSMKGIYTFYKYDNSLYVIALTGQEILDLLEWNAAERLTVKVSNGEANYMCIGDNYTNPIFYGIDFTYDMAQEEGSRVTVTGLANGKEFDVNETYLFAINNYHLGNSSSSELVKYDTTQALWSQTDDLGGGYVQDMIAQYVGAMTEEYGGVYSTEYADKNDEYSSHWSLTYSGDLSAVVLPDETTLVGTNVTELTDGMEIMFYYPAAAVTMPGTGSFQGLDANIVGDKLFAVEGTGVYTVAITESGVTLHGENGYLCDGLALKETADETAYWAVTAASNGGLYFENLDSGKYMEYWNSFKTYDGGELGSIYEMFIYEAEDVATKVSASELNAGDTVVIHYTALDLLVTPQMGGVTSVPAATENGSTILGVTDGALVLTVEISEDGYYMFRTEDGGYLSQASISAEANEYSLWEITETENGCLLRCVNAEYNGTYNQYFEYWNGFSLYGYSGGDATNYTFNLFRISAAEAEVSGLPFEDVAEDAWYYDAVEWAYENGVTTGVTETTFNPTGTVERCQVVTMLWRAAGEPIVEIDNPFTDVSETAYYYNAVLWAYSEGITTGATATTFDPYGECERCEIVTFLWRAAGKPAVEGSHPFTDVAEGAYYCDAVLWAYANGITTGATETTFNPYGNCERAALVTFLYRAQ